MPSFDIVSEHALMVIQNVLGNVERELSSRWDFRNQSFEVLHRKSEQTLELAAHSEMHLRQMLEVLRQHMAKQGMAQHSVDIPETWTHTGKEFRITVALKSGLPKTLVKSLLQALKRQCPKVQAQAQGDKVSVHSKSKDQLQEAIQYLQSERWERPLQFKNFKEG